MSLQLILDRFLSVVEHLNPAVVSAVTSVFSVVVSAVAVLFAFRAYRKQSGQLAIAQKHDLRWQSSKVTAWANSENILNHALMCFTGVDTYIWHGVSYINASDLPVYNARITYRNTAGREITVTSWERLMPTGEEPGGSSLIEAYRIFPESADIAKQVHNAHGSSLRYNGSDAYARRKWLSEGEPEERLAKKQIDGIVAREMEQLERTGALYFTDSEGNSWERGLDGELRLRGYGPGNEAE